MPRLFTGLEIPPDIATELSLRRGGLAGTRWIEPSDYHITLRFLGDVDGATARDVFDFLADIQRSSLTVTLDQIASFGGDKPHSVHARVRPDPALSELQAEHERLMRRIGLAPEPRKFVPHVTLGRCKGASVLAVADYLTTRALVRSLSFTARRFVLYSSRASTGGGPYVVEAAYPLEAQSRQKTA
ncbi:MAG: RNA 2',3'-cyclic phosphodiesterase [Bosea sp. (in: a-proteobacteria)]